MAEPTGAAPQPPAEPASASPKPPVKPSTTSSSDPFMKAAEGRYPLSDNSGAARYWSPDGIPRPDREYWWLLVMSIVFGLVGADHFYLRSPKTGLLKLLTLGGFGLWWFWDAMQLLTEKERILSYGLSTPGDLTTGIGQGSITDKATYYKTNASYSTWTFTTLFGFLGFDSFYLKNMGQGFRKFVEGLLAILSIVGVAKIRSDGFHFSSIFAIMGLAFFGIVSGFQWLITVSQAFSTPQNLFAEGVKMTDLESKQVNSTMSWLINNTSLDPKRKEQVIKDLKYGDMTPEEVQAMFMVYHPYEGRPTVPTPATDESPGSMPSFYILLGAPFLIVWGWISDKFGELMDLIFPSRVAFREMTKIKKGQIAKPGILSKLTSSLKGAAQEAITPAIAAVTHPVEAVQQAVASRLPNTNEMDPLGVARLRNIPTVPVEQRGGNRDRNEPLSLEGTVMAAATIALIGGGAVKLILDNLMSE